MPQEQKQKKKRVPITALTKQQICLKKRENLKLRDEDLAKEYGLDRSTITKILKQREKWLAIDPNSNYAKQKTQKSPKFPQIEVALSEWLTITINGGSTVSDAQLQEKALEFAQLYGLRNEFQASNGWISKFKNRHQFRSGEGQGTSEVSLQVNPQPVPMSGTTVISTSEHSNFSNTVLPPNSHYPPNPSIATSSRTNGTTLIGNASSSQHYLQFGAPNSTSLVNYTPSRMYPVTAAIPPSMILENAAFIFCDYQNDVIGMFQTSNVLNQFLINSKALFQEVNQAKQKKNISSFSVCLSFRPGYPEVSPNNRYTEKMKTSGRLTEGTKGAEFIDGMIPREDDIIIKKRRVDAFYDTELHSMLRARNIRHIILSGIATGDVILSTCRSAADRDLNVTVVRDCCFDGNEMVQSILMNDLFPNQGVMVASLEEILSSLRLA